MRSWPDLLVGVGLAESKSAAGRLLKQGAVKLDGEKVEPRSRNLDCAAGQERTLQVGRRRFVLVRFR